MRGALAWRMLDVTEANGKPGRPRRRDEVPGLRGRAPAQGSVGHAPVPLGLQPRGHALRRPLDLPRRPRVREWIRDCDKRFIPEARKVFANSRTVAERLRRYNRIESEPLYHPPPRAESLARGRAGRLRLLPEPAGAAEATGVAHRGDEVHAHARPRRLRRRLARRARTTSQLVKQPTASAERVSLRGFVPEDEMIELYASALAVCYLPFDEDYGYVTLEGDALGQARRRRRATAAARPSSSSTARGPRPRPRPARPRRMPRRSSTPTARAPAAWASAAARNCSP